MQIKRRLSLLVLGVTIAVPMGIHAEEPWPQKPVRIVVPYATGGSIDNGSRRLALELGKRLGQNVYVENKTGAMSTIGMAEGANAKPDGYTFVTNDPAFVILPYLRKQLPYDPNELVPVGAFIFSPLGVAVNAKSPYKTLQDLVDKAKAEPDKVTFGSGGYGTLPHMGTEEFAIKAGVKLLHVPFKGGGEVVLALMSGTIDMQLSVLSTFKGALANGQVRMLAISGNQRQQALPEVPTFAEAGVKNLTLNHWVGIWAPKGTPQQIVERMQKSILEVMQTPEMKAYAEGVAGEPRAVVGDEFRKLLRSEDAVWKTVVERSGLKPE
jgi:tripartite-type tricarboxylate transporter receptor subunit TctC